MLSAESINKANALIKTTNIKGKEYAEVNQRIKAFRSICPSYSIETEMLSLIDGVVTFKALIKDEVGKILAVGHAQEKENGSFINKTSYIENCETSAVGRALGMLGIGVDTSLASADEVLNAINNQNNVSKGEDKNVPKSSIRDKPASNKNINSNSSNYNNETELSTNPNDLIDDKYIAYIRQQLSRTGISEKSFVSHFGASKIEDMTIEQAVKGFKMLSDKPDKVISRTNANQENIASNTRPTKNTEAKELEAW